MEMYTGAGQIILIFDTYDCESRYLHESIKRAGYDCLAIVIEEDYFLPEDVVLVYDMLSGDWEEGVDGKPIFFNEIVVPDHWSISAGVDEPCGNITYQHEEKGRIYYIEPRNKYLVETVDWLDQKGNIRFRDYYNRYGNICSRTFYNGEDRPVGKTWFSAKGREILIENCVTGDLILNDGALVKHFRTKIELFSYYFDKMGFSRNRIFYSSLPAPFLISNALDASIKGDILFWQRSVGEVIPEHMQMILNGEANRTKKIAVQKRHAYAQLSGLGAKGDRLYRLGFIYPFQKENGHKLEALIYTDSDRIEHCQELIEALPQMQFHIAAITVMSSDLESLGRYSNVSLYPAVKSPVREELFKRCDYYFDINHYAEIISSVQQAFLHNHLIFAFRETLHNREYVADAHIYPAAEFERMVADVRAAMENKTVMEQCLEKQRRHALAEDQDAYMRIIEM